MLSPNSHLSPTLMQVCPKFLRNLKFSRKHNLTGEQQRKVAAERKRTRKAEFRQARAEAKRIRQEAKAAVAPVQS